MRTSGEANSSTNAARSWASDSRSTSRWVRIGAGGQATGPSPVMAGNLTHARRLLHAGPNQHCSKARN
ncbi:hypothetical protein GCM10010145_46970 [Streptomyces ruber]|uniref:Uncharacterized protein n=2 Tax=Streptomyces TaxID=1883 RepID=A0A918BIL6_9ACTN|nr:hypothetical protein GCM10010145_46970 [Streptomyces ruber]